MFISVLPNTNRSWSQNYTELEQRLNGLNKINYYIFLIFSSYFINSAANLSDLTVDCRTNLASIGHFAFDFLTVPTVQRKFIFYFDFVIKSLFKENGRSSSVIVSFILLICSVGFASI